MDTCIRCLYLQRSSKYSADVGVGAYVETAMRREIEMTGTELVKGEVLDAVTITVDKDPHSREGAWRLFSTASRDRGIPLSQRGKLLGGTWDQAITDAERLRDTHGFQFERPSGLWLPSGLPNIGS